MKGEGGRGGDALEAWQTHSQPMREATNRESLHLSLS